MLVPQSPGSMIGEGPAYPRLCNRNGPLFSSAPELYHLTPKYLISQTPSKLPRTKDRKMSYLPRAPNGPRDNSNAFNTTGSSNHNANAQNHNSGAFNTTTYSYANIFVNYTPNEIEEIARRIPGTLSPPFLAHTHSIQSPNMGMPAAPPMSHAIPSAYLPGSSLPMDDPEKEVIIAVMGPKGNTHVCPKPAVYQLRQLLGAGKSYFIREVSGILDIEISDTQPWYSSLKLRTYSFPYGPTKITLVDTPGFHAYDDKRNYEILAEISAWTSSAYMQGKLLSGIIYLHNILWIRELGSGTPHLSILHGLCGSSALRNVLLATTQWSNPNLESGERNENVIRNSSYWRSLFARGATIERFMGTRESGLELINQLIEKEPKPLLIQHQMVDLNMTLEETDVGKCMK
ncbi:hypothetical protein B9Z19DRAFT_1111768 [Tuber borchii]|uniref:G domain-containing protein n=1 Tax=Tuber borchii TaxID=42251 RepID=A0A2T6ZAA1_TUBBO|nr:hypothetical protein B9Z19DRAFT_1111768 [Tuber borchii]